MEPQEGRHPLPSWWAGAWPLRAGHVGGSLPIHPTLECSHLLRVAWTPRPQVSSDIPQLMAGVRGGGPAPAVPSGSQLSDAEVVNVHRAARKGGAGEMGSPAFLSRFACSIILEEIPGQVGFAPIAGSHTENRSGLLAPRPPGQPQDRAAPTAVPPTPARPSPSPAHAGAGLTSGLFSPTSP